MLITSALFASVVVAAVGILIFWSNPARMVNRAVCICSFNIMAWLACRHLLVTHSSGGDALFWVRLICSVGAFAPLSFWLVKESILTTLDLTNPRWLRQSLVWLIVPAILAILPFTEYFIPSYSTDAHRVYGWGYYVYNWGLIGLYALLFTAAIRNIKTLRGGPRLELQVWLGGGCVIACTIYVLIALSDITHDPVYRRLEPVFVLMFYVGTAFAITTYRIFDARQILLVGLEKLALVCSVAGAAYLLDKLFGYLLAEPFALLATTMVALWFAAALNEWLDRIFQFYPQATAARQAAFAAARQELRIDKLEASFLGVLKGWGQTDRALVLSGEKGTLKGSGIEIQEDCIAVRAIRQLRWATPERLSRERSTPERVVLGQFLEEHGLGLVVFAEGPALAVLVGVGMTASRRSFTYPQVTQLMELASIIENALERAHFSVKAQHAEQLATVGLLGASLAHEIRNPLVSIKTFVQHLPQHYQDPAFREKFFKLIGSEVARIDQLTEQLLDLANPRAYVAQSIDLHPVLRSSLDLAEAKATDKRIKFLTDFRAMPDRVSTDPSAVKQILLNLCFNAIQAVEMRDGERWVKISTGNVSAGVEMTVEDSGPGIAPEIRPRLFQPFQSSKSTGFGLGLAVCSDILAGLNATISVDASVPGRGATFRVIFPCQAL
jgi:signal transduction histidine kinase